MQKRITLENISRPFPLNVSMLQANISTIIKFRINSFITHTTYVKRCKFKVFASPANYMKRLFANCTYLGSEILQKQF